MKIKDHTFDQELIDIYDMEGNFVRIQNRKEFCNEIKKEFLETGEINYSVKSVGALIVNSYSDMLLVQRGDTFDSPGLIDKTIGGHVTSGDTFDETIIRELEEEIGIEGIIASDINDFKSLINTIDTTKKAVLLLIDYIDNLIVDVEGEQIYKRSFNASIYMGIFNGEITNFPDGSAKRSWNIPLSNLLEVINKNKNNFTKSLTFLIKKYSKLIISKINL